MPEKLTDALLHNLAPGAPQYAVRDSETRGLMVVVGAHRKTWKIQTEVRDNQGRRTVTRTLGHFPDMRVSEARKIARADLGAIQTRRMSPAPKRSAVTLSDAWDRYRAYLQKRVDRHERSPGTITYYADSVRLHLTKLVDRPLREIAEDPATVGRLHESITLTSGPYAANHAMRALRAIYQFAVDAELEPNLPRNPVRPKVVDFNEERRRDNAMDAKQIGAWWAQVQTRPNRLRREAMLFGLLCGLRDSEICSLRWDDLDLNQRTIRIRRPKGGPKRAFSLILSKPMIRCLWRARREGQKLCAGSPWVFPSAKGSSGHIESIRDDTILGYHPHQLRETYLTMAATLNIHPFLMKVFANHSTKGDVTAGYVTSGAMASVLREEQERMSAALISTLTTKPTDKPHPVIIRA